MWLNQKFEMIWVINSILGWILLVAFGWVTVGSST